VGQRDVDSHLGHRQGLRQRRCWTGPRPASLSCPTPCLRRRQVCQAQLALVGGHGGSSTRRDRRNRPRSPSWGGAPGGQEAAATKASARSVRSQEKSGRSRPKWP
jgi:hypothetical protein